MLKRTGNDQVQETKDISYASEGDRKQFSLLFLLRKKELCKEGKIKSAGNNTVKGKKGRK